MLAPAALLALVARLAAGDPVAGRAAVLEAALGAPPPEAPAGSGESPAAQAPAEAAAAAPEGSTDAPAPQPLRLPSLQSGAALGRGGAAWAFGLGWPYLFAAYAQGVGERDDLGGGLEVDWPASEFVLAGLWRREIAGGGGTHLGLRVRLGLYACFGGTWVWDDNRSDLGLQLSPGVAWSLDTPSGVLSVGGDLPVTWTFERGGGWIMAPRLGVSFETPLWTDVSFGARVAAGVRGAGGGAPGAGEDRAFVEVSFLATWHPF